MGALRQGLSHERAVSAIKENLFDLYRLMRYWPQAEVHDDELGLWTLTDAPDGSLNMVLDMQLAGADVPAAIDGVVDQCRSRGVPLIWLVGPWTGPPGLGAQLVARGFHPGHDLLGMAADLGALAEVPPTRPALDIVPVFDTEGLVEWGRVYRLGFGMSQAGADAYVSRYASVGFGPDVPLRHYVGRAGGEVVVVCSTLLTGDCAGIYHLATVPERRGRGFGTAMVLTVLHQARASGRLTGVLLAGTAAASLCRRLGFDDYCRIGLYVWQPEA